MLLQEECEVEGGGLVMGAADPDPLCTAPLPPPSSGGHFDQVSSPPSLTAAPAA